MSPITRVQLQQLVTDSVFGFRTFLVQIAINTPNTSRGLLAVGSDMTKILAVVALRKASLSSV
jgi:hypothetical protein